MYKLGDGPLYPFWIPYHLPHIETPNAIARVVLFGDNLAPPLAGPSVEVCAVAKRDVKAGSADLRCSRPPTGLRAEQYRYFFGETWIEEFLLVAR